MSTVASWAMSILATVLVGTVLDMFMSEKKMGKIVRGVFASLLVVVIISPLPSLLSGCKNDSMGLLEGGIELDESYLEYANTQKITALENGLVAALSSEGYQKVKAQITAEFSAGMDIKAVRLDTSQIELNKPALNVNLQSRLKKLTAEYLRISVDLVFVQ